MRISNAPVTRKAGTRGVVPFAPNTFPEFGGGVPVGGGGSGAADLAVVVSV